MDEMRRKEGPRAELRPLNREGRGSLSSAFINEGPDRPPRSPHLLYLVFVSRGLRRESYTGKICELTHRMKRKNVPDAGLAIWDQSPLLHVSLCLPAPHFPLLSPSPSDAHTSAPQTTFTLPLICLFSSITQLPGSKSLSSSPSPYLTLSPNPAHPYLFLRFPGPLSDVFLHHCPLICSAPCPHTQLLVFWWGGWFLIEA